MTTTTPTELVPRSAVKIGLGLSCGITTPDTDLFKVAVTRPVEQALDQPSTGLGTRPGVALSPAPGEKFSADKRGRAVRRTVASGDVHHARMRSAAGRHRANISKAIPKHKSVGIAKMTTSWQDS